MQVKKITHRETGYFSSLVLDYLSQNDKLKEFYKYPVSLSSFKKVIEDKNKQPINRKVLVEALTRQNEPFLQDCPAVKENITSLANENTYTITTGHQLCIYGGPAYFIYKIVSVINLARKLKQEYPSQNFVPVFWLASEDHGEGEISGINLFGKKIEYKYSISGASGRRNTDDFESFNQELRSIVGADERFSDILQTFENAYQKNSTLSAATREYLIKLFGEQGLVIIDGDDVNLKKEFTSYMKSELEDQFTFRNVNQTIKELEKDYKSQAHVREINLFYLLENGRERIVREGKGFRVLNTELVFTKEELIVELESHPEIFSPNVLLRPLYEEVVLPNLAYIGGPGELAYWMQLKSNFESQNVNFPMVVLRNSAQWFDKNSISKLKKIGFSIQEIFEPNDLLETKLIEKYDSVYSIEHRMDKLETLFEELKEEIASIDQSLSGTIEAEKTKQIKALQNIEARVNKAIRRKNETELNQLRNLKEKLFPGNGLQERKDNFMNQYVKHEDYLNILFENLDPLDQKVTLFIED